MKTNTIQYKGFTITKDQIYEGSLIDRKDAWACPRISIEKVKQDVETTFSNQKKMKKKHYKIHLIEVTDKDLEEAPSIVQKVYRAIQNKETVTKQEKELAVMFTDYFRLEEVQMKSFSQAFKRISNIKEAIRINTKKNKINTDKAK
jgi:hypothetical protein